MNTTVLVTRPAAQAAGWVQQLRDHGIAAAALPLIDIAPPADAAAVTGAWYALAGFVLVVFVSPNAAEQFFALRPAGAPWPPGTRAAATGPGTSQALRAFGLGPSQIAEPAADAPQFDSEALWAQLAGERWAGRQVLIVRGDGGRDWLADTLRGHGATVAPLAAYRRNTPSFTPAQQALLAAAWSRPAEHVWLFSSSEAIGALLALAPAATWAGAQAVATHPRIAATAQRAGFGRVTLARPDVHAVVACLQSLPPNPAP